MEPASTPISERQLTLTREVNVSREDLYRGWTDPAMMKKWFAPLPYTVAEAELDVRPGGRCKVVMQAPDGTLMPGDGVYLEVQAPERLVFTDAYTAGWEPNENLFMTTIIQLDDLGGGKTRYTATVRHWSAEKKQQHEAMGFHEGWGQCLDQLVELIQTGTVTAK